MEMKKPFRRKPGERGQATVEYILMLGMAVSVISVFTVGMRRTTVTLWSTFIREIAAACPGCPADDRYRTR
jgi:hypothetical protein